MVGLFIYCADFTTGGRTAFNAPTAKGEKACPAKQLGEDAFMRDGM